MRAAETRFAPSRRIGAPNQADIVRGSPLSSEGGVDSNALDEIGNSAPPAATASSARPRYKNNPEPVYPVVARRRGQQGSVLLSVRVDAAGRPETVAIKTSSGFAALDEAAVAAVKRWEFEPGRLAGEPVPSQVEVPIRFELDRD